MSFLVPEAYAQCPVCIVTVGGGLLIAKKLGIDDLLVSIWISGLNTALSFWIARSMKNRFLRNPLLWTLGFFLTSITYLYFSKQIGHPQNMFLGIDKVLLGMLLGLVVSLSAIGVDQLLRKSHNNKVYFPYQKVVVPLAMLVLTTLLFKFLLPIKP
ncbi:MAG: hypothetical protein WC775_04075 [Patescibacteria group bacterium]|jgi:hypothetical protein